MVGLNRRVANVINFIQVFLPVLLLVLAVVLPNSGSQITSHSNKPGLYYTGDSWASRFYNITEDELPALNDLWLKGMSESLIKDWFNAQPQNKTRISPTIRCGWRWEYKQAEIGAYCYDSVNKLLHNYATPPVINYIKSQKGSEAANKRVILLQKRSDQGSVSFKMQMDSKSFVVVPASELGRVWTKADALSTVKCQIGKEVIEQNVGAWALFDKGTALSSITKSTAAKLIRYQVTSGGQRGSIGSLFGSVSSFTSIAAYCDRERKGQLLVGWGGNYFSYGEKFSGFLLAYWPLLLMYLVSFTICGHAYGSDMIKGYDAFMRTGSATYTAIQIVLFNERIYHTLFNLFASDDFKNSRVRFQIELTFIGITFVIFQHFIVSVATKTCVGKFFTKYENILKYTAFFLTLALLGSLVFVPAVTGNEFGTNRQCEFRTSICFHEYNSTYAFFLVNFLSYATQLAFMTIYRKFVINGQNEGSSKNSRVVDQGDNCNNVGVPIETEYRTCFEQHCMNYTVPREHYDTDIYSTQDEKQLNIGKYIRFCGFIQIKGLGIIRTKDLWILYASKILPHFFKSDVPVSLILWKMPTPNHVVSPVRLFWEFLEVPEIIALENDVGWLDRSEE